jgi:daunorubicin resistance ABC transporter membrane protein
MLAAWTLWRREMVRFLRQRSRVASALAQPLVFWLLLGGGLSGSFRPPGAGTVGYLEYFYPGILTMVLLFTAIFATISTVEDRHSGFLQGVLVAPVARAEIVIGQTLGATSLAVLEGVLFLALAPLAGISLSVCSVLATVGVMALVASGLVGLGLMIAWRMDSTQGFHALMNLVLIPIWLLSGALFPRSGLARPLAWVMDLNPLTYGVAALRRCLYLAAPGSVATLPALGPSLAIAAAFSALSLGGAVLMARRSASL